MDTEETGLNPTPAETDSAQTSESVETGKSENRVEKDPSYMKKSADRVEEIYSTGRRAHRIAVAQSLKSSDRKLFLRRGSSVHTAAQF